MTLAARYRRLPLRAKLTLWTTACALTLVVVMAATSLRMLHADMTRAAADAQTALINGVARDIDEKIEMRLHALEMQALGLGHQGTPLTPDAASVEALDEFFRSRPLIGSYFDALLIADANGRLVYDAPHLRGRIGLMVADRAYFQQVMSSGVSVITQPVVGKVTGRPSVHMAVPLRDDRGVLIGVLAGALHLDAPNFLNKLGSAMGGGQFALVAKDGQLIAHPDLAQLMQPLPLADNPGLAAAMRGDDMTVVGRNAAGDDLLYSYRNLAAAPWVLQAVYPTAEAYAQLRLRERQVLAIGGVMALCAGLIVWALTTRLLRPLEALRLAMSDDSGAGEVHADSAEIAALLAAYRAQAARRREVEAALARSEKRLNQIADNIPALVSYVDLDQRYRYTNATYRKMLGYVDTIGKTMLDVLGPATHTALQPHIALAMCGVAQSFERPFHGPQGDGTVQVDYVPAFDAAGQAEGFYVMMIDITARKKAENALTLSERRLRAIADNLPALVGYVDRSERYRFMNAEYRAAFGQHESLLLGKTCRDLLGETNYRAVKPHIDAALRGERQHFERFAPRNGQPGYAMVDYVPDVAADGAVEGYYVMVLDIAARRQAEMALAESEGRVRAIADNLPGLIAHYDRDQRLTFVNARVAELHGKRPEACVGVSMLELRGPETYLILRPNVERALAGEQVTFEIDGSVGDEVHHYTSTYVPDVGPDGGVRGFYALTLDITDRKRMEISLARSEQRMRTITDNLPALISQFDRDGRYAFANKAVGQTFGCHPGDLLGRTVREVRGDAIADVVEPHIARALSGKATSFETTGPLPGGGLQHFHATYLPEIDTDGQVHGIYALTFDITERKAAELARLASERHLQDLINTIPAVVAYFDMAQRCQYANDSGLRGLGIDRNDVPGISMRDALGETVWAQHAPYVDEVLAGSRAHFEGKVPFGERAAHYQAHLIPDRDASGVQRGYYLMTFDITALKEAQHRQSRVEAQLRSVTDNLPVLISYVDRECRFTFLNATFNAWMGVDTAATVGRYVRDVVGEEGHLAREPYFRRVFAGERVEFEMTTGQRRLRTVYVPDIESDGRVVGSFCLSSDITAMKEAEHQLTLLVRSDALTGLANRYRFNEALPEALARSRRSGNALALMFLDIDRFKQINDQLGHGVGDEALQEFAARLQQSVRLTDLVARLAGDEFVIILEGLHTPDEAQAIAQKILEAVNRPFLLSSGPLNVTTSLGIAYQPVGASGEDQLLARADEALYQAKAAGRNTYCLVAAG